MIQERPHSDDLSRHHTVPYNNLHQTIEINSGDSPDDASTNRTRYPQHADPATILRTAPPVQEGRREAGTPGSGKLEENIPFPPARTPGFTFIDLFAGIGGMRLAFQQRSTTDQSDQGPVGRCVFSSEIDSFAKITYKTNFGEVPNGDITAIREDEIPDHDVLTAGFPCQAFSIAGRRLGFEETRGTLFFDIARILHAKRPQAFLLENVKGLTHHNRGRTLATILEVLRNDLGYTVPEPKVLNAKYYGVPQNRERIIIVGFRDAECAARFAYPKPLNLDIDISTILEGEPVSAKYFLSQMYLDTLREHRRRHENKGNGFGFEVIEPDGIANAIVVGGMGRERNLVRVTPLEDPTPVTKIKGPINEEGIRRMTPREWARLQGFPDSYRLDRVSDAQAYKQLGNSVAVPAIRAVALQLLAALEV